MLCDENLMVSGCGRFFEGNAEEMHKALNETLASLPDDTKVYVCCFIIGLTEAILTSSSLATNTPRQT